MYVLNAKPCSKCILIQTCVLKLIEQNTKAIYERENK